MNFVSDVKVRFFPERTQEVSLHVNEEAYLSENCSIFAKNIKNNL